MSPNPKCGQDKKERAPPCLEGFAVDSSPIFFAFLAAEGAALEATICLSGSKEISVLVMHFWIRPCPFC